MNDSKIVTLKMDKPQKATFKKSFVRNPELTKPKAIVIRDSECSLPPPKSLPEKPSVNDKPRGSLTEPELNSALKIVKEIESLNSIKLKKPSCTELKKHVVLDEKAAKQVNIPHHQKIYKDLIPLCLGSSAKSTLPTITRDYQVIKDEEPVLSDFYNPKKLPEYSFKVPVQRTEQSLNKQFDGFKMYRMMRNWD